MNRNEMTEEMSQEMSQEMTDDIAGQSAEKIADRIRQVAATEGFAACGMTPAVTSEGFANLVRWIDSGYAGEMDYFAKRLDAYRHPAGVLEGARSVVVLAMPYDCRDPQSAEAMGLDSGAAGLSSSWGRVARYTWQGSDYHDDIHPKLKRICRLIESMNPDAKARGVVDTAPLMEREIAQLAGLGWRGKNTLLLNRSLGSYFFLACVLVDIELPSDDPHATSHCGTCTACLDACPTDAFVGPHLLDASKCISYLTIESRDSIAEDLRLGVGDWLFGCDVCQEVCPWNRKPARRAGAASSQSAAMSQPAASSRSGDEALGRLELLSLFELSDEGFRARFRKSPMWRTRRRGLLRNAAIVLGNVGDLDALPVLEAASGDDEPLIREAARWAIGQIRDRWAAQGSPEA